MGSVRTTEVGGVSAPSGDAFVVVDLVLRNNSSVSHRILAPLFSVQTPNGLEFMGDAVTEAHPQGCKSTASLAPGGNTRCTIVFTAPANETTSLVAYTAEGSGDRYQAPLKTGTCGICDGQCHDLLTDPDHCGACNVPAGAGTCVEGRAICQANAERCDGKTCVDLLTSPNHCGTCNNPEPVCVDGQGTCKQGQTSCDGVCKSLGSDPSNCGTCGRQCPGVVWGDYHCSGGSCESIITTTELATCDSVCSAHGLECEYAVAAYAPQDYEFSAECNATPKATDPNNLGKPLHHLDCYCSG
ncbi:DUF4352 domain-containing protein [Polyangium sp. 15x6]|uniref:DUF4352 domain-containing protein n=1 Tax=Polyangium sp. 15x6 TaxID=3042687 RepID=UPI00249CBBDE|nr:DUF4352 domain-containing protein [Polyangium sp. 15x6]MDI3285184.1 DUF4352 domain-containing protein [Polyangium sp. 15x6]